MKKKSFSKYVNQRTGEVAYVELEVIKAHKAGRLNNVNTVLNNPEYS